MASAEPQGTFEVTDLDSSWGSASKLSRKVRDLAQRSFRAIKTGSPSLAENQAESKDVLEDLRELLDDVARLHQKIHARELDGLIPWVDALREQVENRLGHAGKAGK
jgi:hypothetical protein